MSSSPSRISSEFRNATTDFFKKSSGTLRNLQAVAFTSWESTAKATQDVVTSRFGFARLTGLVMIPSQYTCPNYHSSLEMVRALQQQKALEMLRVKPFQLSVKSGALKLQGLVCYPPRWKEEDHSRCLVLHNPNAQTLAEFFHEGRLYGTVEHLMQINQCPFVLYDYRGTGLSSEPSFSSSVAFKPTYHSIVEDGLAVVRYALSHFDKACAWGISLGGGVATISTAKYLDEKPEDVDRLEVVNHDSFTSTAQVVLPRVRKEMADFICNLVGGKLDAVPSMENLLNRNVKICVLCHRADPVIPQGARMAEFALQQSIRSNLTLIESDAYAHGSLTLDMRLRLLSLN